VDNPDMFLSGTQGIDLPERCVSVDRRQIGVGDRLLSTGAELLEGTVGNFAMAGLRSRNPQVISTRSLPIIPLINNFSNACPHMQVFSHSYTQHSACGKTEVQLR
jgi:hypothetical protein